MTEPLGIERDDRATGQLEGWMTEPLGIREIIEPLGIGRDDRATGH